MKRIIFLGSGGGGNLKFIHAYSKIYRDLFKIIFVITDRQCGARDYALKEEIPCEIMTFKREEEEDKLLLELISNSTPDYIITNVHKILSERIVNEFKGKLLNLHYSYLPAFSGVIGMTPVDQALERNNLFIGCTMHFVNEQVDAGKTISQGIIIYKESENIYQSVFECGALTLISGLFKMCGLEDTNFKLVNEYIISPYSTILDVNVTRNILLNLQKQL